MEEGDIVILASDGLFDNLYDDEIMEEVQKCVQHPMTNQCADQATSSNISQAISDALALRAKGVSEDPDNPTSPFQVRAMHEGLYYQVSLSFKKPCDMSFFSYLYFSVGRKT